jgi:hypothetical protein
MPKKLLNTVWTFVLSVTVAFSAQADAGNQNYKMSTSVISASGMHMRSEIYRMDMTLAPPSTIGQSNKRPYVNFAGFWYTFKKDFDRDRLPDDWEFQFLEDIKISDGTGDYDRDKLNDMDEYLIGTDPTDSDTDGDQVPDGWEVENDLNPSLKDALLDPDEDRCSNYCEWKNGTDPHDKKSSPFNFIMFPIKSKKTGKTAIIYLD